LGRQRSVTLLSSSVALSAMHAVNWVTVSAATAADRRYRAVSAVRRDSDGRFVNDF
jgi:hypothetical protein